MSNYFNGNGTIGFTCDVCGRELNSCSVVNGMKFCAKCYQETFGKDNQQNEIQQLKQKLAEKDKEIKKLTLLYFGDENTETILTTNKMIQHIKISFAVEQLEKVKEIFAWGKNNGYLTLENAANIIDNQIKQLKEMKGNE